MPPSPADAPENAAPERSQSQRPHRAARIEDRVRAVVSRVLRARGWTPRVDPFTGYGTTRHVRVLARVLLTSPDHDPARALDRRGWRTFLSAPAPGETVRVQVGETVVDAVSDRGGYLDTTVETDLEAGWHEATLRPSTGTTVAAPILVVGEGRRLGVVSDIDDTVMVTTVPRLFLAAWNTFVRHTSARVAVPGMAVLYRAIADAHPGTPFVYLSTGAWNTSANLQRFLERTGLPPGPLLLTDWGPSNSGWFRSGPEHKRTSLDRLFRELPEVDWLLIGDDGQRDPEIYARSARRDTDRVVAVAIRELTPAQQVLAHGTPTPGVPGAELGGEPLPVPVAAGPDGVALARSLRDVLREGDTRTGQPAPG
ncbi:App1 family protein [Oerskovia flava]|uniref:App1 family protein n=1 Tax=Oerskovia flava TaxID=2986422 RepID=UPI0022408ECC|nr:phosphatase domain-containing protein [Oerskovia sp. JB1-3-2]